ncbi:uncharacterized protein LOC135483307 [Lineus longissimus]|uniref:uncharacterized protein LOC135483307 n=1 Tax=Lineus longissimus TaxID=88925 RepID=UPI00315DC6DE
MAEVCKLLDIEKTRCTPGHPQSDGVVERFNKTLLNMLASYVSANQKDWDEHLPYLMMAYRSSRHESTRETPNALMLGREVSLPIDVMMGLPESEQPLEETEYALDLREKMESAFEHVRLQHSTRYSTVKTKEGIRPFEKRIALQGWRRSVAVEPDQEERIFAEAAAKLDRTVYGCWKDRRRSIQIAKVKMFQSCGDTL